MTMRTCSLSNAKPVSIILKAVPVVVAEVLQKGLIYVTWKVWIFEKAVRSCEH